MGSPRMSIWTRLHGLWATAQSWGLRLGVPG
jgi:hypothetical protein